jgi:hypothetical protein
MKTRDGARLRLAAARHLFARYPVAQHPEQIWMEECVDFLAGKPRAGALLVPRAQAEVIDGRTGLV